MATLTRRAELRRQRAARPQVCLGFDGSMTSDHTGIRAETLDGWQFTPTYGPSKRATHWNPAEWNGRIPRDEVHVAVGELFARFNVERIYCDPHEWQSEIETWEGLYGEEHVITWDTGRGYSRIAVVHMALERMLTDLTTGALTHDGCPITELHVGNARKVAKPGDRYVIGKPSPGQKIDMAMCSLLAHEAACDARSAGWKPHDPKPMIVRRR